MEAIFSIPGYQIKYLSKDDIPIINKLVYECKDYFIIVNGIIPTQQETLEILNDLPPGKSYNDKYVIGIFNEQQKLVSIIELVKDYPVQNCCWIGLLLIIPDERRKGFGSIIYKSIHKWLSGLKTREIRLGVVEQNERALKFWLSLGFEVIEKRQPKKYGKLEYSIIVMKQII